MDVRDLFFWVSEAKRKGIVRRLEAANAVLMPYQDKDVIKREMESLRSQATEIDQAEEITALEQENAVQIAAAKERRAVIKKGKKRPKKGLSKSSKVRRF